MNKMTDFPGNKVTWTLDLEPQRTHRELAKLLLQVMGVNLIVEIPRLLTVLLPSSTQASARG